MSEVTWKRYFAMFLGRERKTNHGPRAVDERGKR
jgi:hypothetical protein